MIGGGTTSSSRPLVAATTTIAIALATLVSACTFFSGVEELELRTTPADASTTKNAADGGSSGSTTDPTFPSASSSSSGGKDGTTPPTPVMPGPTLCGATGTWTACEIADTLVTCAERCQAKGLGCVESCCAYDELGDFAAKAGMVYATPGLTCDLSSVPSTSSAGLCNDPVLPIAQGLMDVRCCCR